tara:strand:+ start:350 stop:1081 length:732 start_codon:yes stop_codon:yes gene_type:complete
MNALMAIAKETRQAYKPGDKPFVCKYCSRGFSREKTLSNHVCEQKRRWQQEKDKGVQMGLQAYLRFYETTQGSGTKKTYGDFVNSQYYNAFVKFGKHIIEIKAINPSAFINHVLKKNVKLDRYCRDENYQNYLEEHLKTETWQDAIARSLKTMENWADQNGVHLHTYFFAANPNQICSHIVNGRVSSWVIFNCETGVNFLGKMNPEQLQIVYPYIDPDFWRKHFVKYHVESAIVKEALKEAKL